MPRPLKSRPTSDRLREVRKAGEAKLVEAQEELRGVLVFVRKLS